MRTKRNNHDAYLQTFNRLQQYAILGHTPDKIELIIMGGTFPAYDTPYQDKFVKEALQGINDFGAIFYPDGILEKNKFIDFFELPHDKDNPELKYRLQRKINNQKKESTLENTQSENETAKLRCVALCIETKPDWCRKNHINQMLKLGATRVELGVQTLYEQVLKKTNRGHTLKDTIKATQLLKDSLLKVCYHMMPGLIDTTEEMDMYNLTEIFKSESYRPDALKIYPTMVMPGTPLLEQYKKGEFIPLRTEKAADLLVKAKENIPPYCRVMRVQRDIPTKVTVDGVDITNFRQYVHALMKKQKKLCRCIRCREPRQKEVHEKDLTTRKMIYNASQGTEVFISKEDKKNDFIVGFCRLRIPFEPFREEITPKTAGIRQLHVYGQAVRIGVSKKEAIQHKGIGTELVDEAEKIAREGFDCRKMAVIAGVGAREYYKKKWKYKKEGPYMVKGL